MTVEAGVAEILRSKKYSGLDRVFVERVFAETAAKYPGKPNHKDVVKAVKRELHIIYGAFLKQDCHTRAAALINSRIGAMNSGLAGAAPSNSAGTTPSSHPGAATACHHGTAPSNSAGTTQASHPGAATACHPGAAPNDCIGDALFTDKKLAMQLMGLHISTSERIGCLIDIYDWIGGFIGANDTVADIGCGFNPFALPFLQNLPRAYNAYDIDGRTVSLLNAYFSLFGESYRARTFDAITQAPCEPADVALLFKLFPLLERRQKGRAPRLLCELFSLCGPTGPARAPYETQPTRTPDETQPTRATDVTVPARAPCVHTAIVSFPTKSASGRDVGMEPFYTDLFTSGLPDSLAITGKAVFANEIFFVVKKSNYAHPG